MHTVRVGVGAGYSGDRFDAASLLVERAELDYLVFECLAERTIALGQRARLNDAQAGYDPFLERRLRTVLPVCVQRGVRIVTNMGAANPAAAGRRVAALARDLGLRARIAVVLGDDVLTEVLESHLTVAETGRPVRDLRGIVSANAYLGAEPIQAALEQEADIVITGRVADPSLVLAPIAHAHGWAPDDWQRMGAGTVVGHLLECTTQVTGGYFADPGYKDVPDLANLGYPIGLVEPSGDALITKTPGSGGLVSPATCKEQLLYEIHDPRRYLTPDVTADFTNVRFEEVQKDVVRVSGGRGSKRPDSLKVSLGYLDGFVGEGQISYGGPGALARARLAGEVVLDRLEVLRIQARETRVDCIGLDSLFGPSGRDGPPPAEVRLRVAVRTATAEEAAVVGEEVEALWLSGPAGGGGATKSVREVLGVVSTFLPRAAVRPEVVVEDARP
ncbi:MAG: DUF1446 domain-containing protein [Chloroflexota bacterium]|nr:DUF1446 domain-containing protein [Chloroflexota bacterium]